MRTNKAITEIKESVVKMGLSVSRASLGDSLGNRNVSVQNNTKNNIKNSPEIPPSTSTTTGADLNLQPNAVYFKGQAAVNREIKETYGPYDLSAEELKINDKETQFLVNKLAEGLSSKSKDKSKQEYEFPYKRASQKAIDEMVPACMAMFSYYMSTPTSFPMFYDTMVRAFPKACSEADRRMHNDNTARLYDKTMQEVKQLGYKADPETDNPIRDGIAYMYFADDLPAFDNENSSAYMAIDRISKGEIPEMTTGGVYPRCHMSKVPDEIKQYGTPIIREKFSENSDGQVYTIISENIWGMEDNQNITKWEVPTPEELERIRKSSAISAKPKKEGEYINLEEFVGEMMKGIL